MHLQSLFLLLESMCTLNTLTLACKHVPTDARWPCLGCTNMNKQSGPSKAKSDWKAKVHVCFLRYPRTTNTSQEQRHFSEAWPCLFFFRQQIFIAYLTSAWTPKVPAADVLTQVKPISWKLNSRGTMFPPVAGPQGEVSRYSQNPASLKACSHQHELFGTNDSSVQFICSDQCWMKCRFTHSL